MADKPQTYLLGVNLQCCAACPNTTKKKLLKIKGVKAVDIDVNKGLISVTGVVASSVLINAVKKNGRNAVLVSSKEENKEEEEKKEEEKMKEEEAKSKRKKEEINKCSYKNGGREEPGCDSGGGNDKESGNKPPSKGGIKWEGDFANFIGSGYSGGPVQLHPPPVQYQYPPMPLHYGGGPPPMPGFLPPPIQNQPPPIKINSPPKQFPDDFYQRKPDLQAENTIFQLFRDDNVNSCSMM